MYLLRAALSRTYITRRYLTPADGVPKRHLFFFPPAHLCVGYIARRPRVPVCRGKRSEDRHRPTDNAHGLMSSLWPLRGGLRPARVARTTATPKIGLRALSGCGVKTAMSKRLSNQKKLLESNTIQFTTRLFSVHYAASAVPQKHHAADNVAFSTPYQERRKYRAFGSILLTRDRKRKSWRLRCFC